MALKADRQIDAQDISRFMDVTASRGTFVCYGVGGSGSAMDQGVQTAVFNSTAGAAGAAGHVSGTIGNAYPVIGMLMNDVVNKDLTQTHLNSHKDEVQVGSKVCIATRGWAVTDQLRHSSSAPTIGAAGFLCLSGQISADGALASGGVVACKFESLKDTQTGFVKVSFPFFLT